MSDGWRKPYQQKKYREQSQSEYKDEKQVSHQVSIKVAKHIDNQIPGPTAQTNQYAVNESSNFYMKTKDTNQSHDNKLDNGIIRKMESGERLTQAETDRARIQAREIQSNENYTEAFKEKADALYTSMNSADGKVVWDHRHQ